MWNWNNEEDNEFMEDMVNGETWHVPNRNKRIINDDESWNDSEDE
jgi:hypothetical protein